MKIQILELPSTVMGDAVHTPFAVIVSESPWTDAEVADKAAVLSDFFRGIGAEDTLVTKHQVEVGL